MELFLKHKIVWHQTFGQKFKYLRLNDLETEIIII